VVARLEQAAKRGDVAAARELREWRRLDPAQSAGQDALRLAQLIGELSARQREALRRWLLDQLRADEVSAQQDGREGPVEEPKGEADMENVIAN
jgi:DNA-directed RNA polymerase specialized sigma24 family protein